MGTDAHRIVLDVETADDSLRGWVTGSDGRIHEFSGWLGLFAALQSLLPGTDKTPEGHET